MSELMSALEKAQADTLTAIRTQHEQTLEVLGGVVDGFRSYWEGLDTSAIAVDPRELAANYMEFSQALVNETRAFTDSVMDVWMPKEASAPKPVKKAS